MFSIPCLHSPNDADLPDCKPLHASVSLWVLPLLLFLLFLFFLVLLFLHFLLRFLFFLLRFLYFLLRLLHVGFSAARRDTEYRSKSGDEEDDEFFLMVLLSTERQRALDVCPDQKSEETQRGLGSYSLGLREVV